MLFVDLCGCNYLSKCRDSEGINMYKFVLRDW